MLREGAFMSRIELAENAGALSHMVAEQFLRRTTDALRERGRCAVALSGGSTPKALYRVLAAEPFRVRVRWDQIDVFWGDERHVPPDHPDSNYRMTAETLLSDVPVRAAKVHRIHGESPDAVLAAHEYETEIRTTLDEPVGTPRFDLILLGLGTDGHTASLFPGTSALDERQRLCVANWVAALGVHRITLTLPIINAARDVMFVVSGVEKAAIVRRVLRDHDATPPFPAQLVQPAAGELWWMLDRAAAGEQS
jgi:6-phosphogluconolactonase